jgi:hypothetical protein
MFAVNVFLVSDEKASAMLKTLAAGVMTITLGVVPTSAGSVSVAYAGSLVATMKGGDGRMLPERAGLRFFPQAALIPNP